MSFFGKLIALFNKIIFWCLGFFIAGFIFFIAIFYVIPVVTGLPLDSYKYISETTQRIEANKNYTANDIVDAEKTDATTLSESIVSEIDKSADDLIKWINQ